ncbi:MAG: alpha/beta fold hydrolase [Gammaproteobacteria bacterium]|nr:alpha/beta fold hydrolase [Gammaproteobacteria bacterium]
MSFNPPAGLRNPHLQTILSSVGPRRMKVRAEFKAHQVNEQPVILQCQQGVRLAGFYNRAASQQATTLVTLIHGWEGSAESSYMLSMTNTLLAAGIDVFRLNLRDHGDTHHLNEGVFNSTMLEEVIDAIADLQTRFEYPDHVLGGFSLGGNFACRVAAAQTDQPLRLSKVVAFCPLLHARETSAALSARENLLYDQYFVRKWKRSLTKKLEYYPQHDYGQKLASLKTLAAMNQNLVPDYTPFKNLDDYYDAYAITGDRLSSTRSPLYLHFSEDDMIIPVADIEKLAGNDDIHVMVTEYGGHCGFLMNWKLDSWQDQRMLDLVRN